MTLLLHCATTSSSDTHLLMAHPRPLASLLSRLLPTLWALAADNPILLAYLLYFSPYLAKAAGFLLPLMLTTTLLAAAAVLPSLLLFPASSEGVQDDASLTAAVAACGGHEAAAAGPSSCAGSDAEEPGGVGHSGLLGVVWWELQGCVDSATQLLGHKEAVDEDDLVSAAHQHEQVQQQQRDVADDKESPLSSPAQGDNGTEEDGGPRKDAPSPSPIPTTTRAGVITWQEFEAIGKLYKALTQDMPLPIKLAAAVRSQLEDASGDKPSVLLHPSTHSNLPAAPDKDAARQRTALLSRCHSRASPLEGWETPWGSELDANGEAEEFFSATQGLMAPWRSESMNWSKPGAGPAAAALARFGGSVREGQWRRDTMLASKSVSVQGGLWARSRSVAAGVDEDGMDMLWEEYEDDGGEEGNNSNWGGCEKGNGASNKKKNKSKFSRWGSKAERREVDAKPDKFHRVVEEENDADDDDDFDSDSELGGGGRLCCLQALRFSTGRMRFGIGKLGTGFARASRAIKGTTLAAFHRHHAAHGSASSATTSRRAAGDRKRP